jgi:serine/threonine-protein kinase HipA
VANRATAKPSPSETRSLGEASGDEVSFAPVDVIRVSAWGRVVGFVARDPSTNCYAFEYDDEWIRSGADLSPLRLPRQRGVFVFPHLSRDTYYGLPAMVADALPDKFGTALVTAWLTEQGVGAAAITALDRLAYASERTMGALTFAPTGPLPGGVNMVDVAQLVVAARAALHGDMSSRGDHDALHQLINVGSTAGGARAKAVVAFNPQTKEMRSGQLDAPEGFEQWLIKLDGVGDPASERADSSVSSQQYCRVEYAYYLMALRGGLVMSPSFLLLEGPRAHFMTKRFDRGPENLRLHLQSLCALDHLDFNLAHTHSYSSYFLTADRLGLDAADRGQIFRRVAFNVMGVNRDDHTKNVAFLLPENGRWELAPAYDVTHANWGSDWTAQHQMSANGRFSDITFDDLRALGDRHEVPGIENALRDVAAAIETWPDAASEAGVDDTTLEKVASDLQTFWPR